MEREYVAPGKDVKLGEAGLLCRDKSQLLIEPSTIVSRGLLTNAVKRSRRETAVSADPAKDLLSGGDFNRNGKFKLDAVSLEKGGQGKDYPKSALRDNPPEFDVFTYPVISKNKNPRNNKTNSDVIHLQNNHKTCITKDHSQNVVRFEMKKPSREYGDNMSTKVRDVSTENCGEKREPANTNITVYGNNCYIICTGKKRTDINLNVIGNDNYTIFADKPMNNKTNDARDSKADNAKYTKKNVQKEGIPGVKVENQPLTPEAFQKAISNLVQRYFENLKNIATNESVPSSMTEKSATSEPKSHGKAGLSIVALRENRKPIPYQLKKLPNCNNIRSRKRPLEITSESEENVIAVKDLANPKLIHLTLERDTCNTCTLRRLHSDAVRCPLGAKARYLAKILELGLLFSDDIKKELLRSSDFSRNRFSGTRLTTYRNVKPICHTRSLTELPNTREIERVVHSSLTTDDTKVTEHSKTGWNLSETTNAEEENVVQVKAVKGSKWEDVDLSKETEMNSIKIDSDLVKNGLYGIFVLVTVFGLALLSSKS